jgi:5'-nucleotidase
VAVVGVTTPATPHISSPGPGIRFADPADTVRREVEALGAMGVDKIIVLSHLGYDQDRELAASVDGVDIIVGGHSHSLLGGQEVAALGMDVDGPFPFPVKTPDGGTCYVVQAGSHARALGILDVVFDAGGRVLDISGQPVFLTGDRFREKAGDGTFRDLGAAEARRAAEANPSVEIRAGDPEALAVLEPFRRGVLEMGSRVVARVAETLRHSRVPRGTGEGDRTPASDLLPLVCRSMIWKMEQTGTRVDLALQNAGGIRKPVPGGSLTVGTVLEVLPFANTLVVMEVSGKALLQVLDRAVDRAAKGNTGAFPGLAGARMILRSRSDGRVPSLETVEIRDPDRGWIPLDPGRTYTLVTNSYLAGGGDRYSVLEASRSGRYDTGFVDAEVFMEYAGTLGVLERPDPGWIVIRP